VLKLKYPHYFGMALLLWFNQPVYAHTIKIFAMSEGDKISGYVYFPGGGRAQQVQVNIDSSSINKPDKVITNLQGEFTYQVIDRTDYVLTVNTDDGHRTEYTIKADELSENLPSLPIQNGKQEILVEPPSSSLVKPIESVNTTSLSTIELSNLLEKTISHQLRPLREQLEGYEAKTRLHDILGGMGYIFGIMGLIFYLGTRNRS